MSRELICSWLKIPPDPWPPDHYTLVGLQPGESDAARIERHIHERHECLLRYQLMHPEQVTEALNCLAKAFVCLTDPAAKQIYDAALLGKPVAPALPVKTAAPLPTRPLPDPLAWLQGPWSEGSRDKPAAAPLAKPAAGVPSPTAPQPDFPVSVPAPALANGTVADAAAAPSPQAVAPPPTDPVVQAAQSTTARRGLGTKRALYYRISRTRQLIRAWVQVGKFVGDATTQLRKRSDAVEFVRQLTGIRQLLRGFPPLLGQAGQPGYLVIALARQPMILPTFLGLLPTQREALVRDWQAGLALLAAHRLFLREELWGLRRLGRFGQVLRIVQALFGEHPGLWLLFVALASLNVIFKELLDQWKYQAGVLAMLVLLFVLFRGTAHRQTLGRTRRTRSGEL